MNAPYRAIVITLSATLLAACVPGQHLATDTPPTPDLIESGHVKVVPITPELVASAAAPVAQVPQELLDYQPDSYRVRPGDSLLVTVWDHPELTTPAGSQQTQANGRLVEANGTMYFPYVGRVQVAGKTLDEVREILRRGLSRYLREPQVDVGLANPGGLVALEGAFTTTAPQPITPVPLTLAQAIGRAGINTEQADLSGLTLIRDGRSYVLDYDALNRQGNVAPDIYLKPGDRLFLPFNDNRQVFVVGEVVRPQAITYRTSSMNLTQALGRVGGLNPVTSNGKAVYVIRGVDAMQEAPQGSATVFQLDARSPAAFVLADRFALRPGDVVFVGPAGITRWNRVLSQLLPLSGIISNVSRATIGGD
ncbi:MAG TPA: polysaccharide biosynthesis/export family protein [Lysobacter sp.]|nr:polysaccharide biosynthesis/export family protein [Lysobacter sp.]